MPDHRPRAPGLQAALFGLLLLAGLGFGDLAIPRVYGSTLEAEDISIVALPEPPGESFHGYTEIRFEITNRSPSRQILVRLESEGGGGRRSGSLSVGREVTMAPRSSSILSLPIPAMQYSFYAFAAYIDGQPAPGSIALRRSAPWLSGIQGKLLLVDRQVSPTAFSTAFGESKPSHDTSSIRLAQFDEGIQRWSTNWLAYTRFDGIILRAIQFDAAPAPVREAVWRYVESGGVLLLLGRPDLPERAPKHLASKLGRLVSAPIMFGHVLVHPETDLENLDQPAISRAISLFEATQTPWMTARHRSSPTTDFPPVAGINLPGRNLFLLLLAFAIIIGPVNLIVLARKQRRIWIFWTIPVFSVITCALLFAYAVWAEGWEISVRTRLLTYLDESTHRAVTIGGVALYSPLTSGDGLRFSHDTELAPLSSSRYDYYNSERQQRIELTSGQHLAEGWLTARIPTFFLVRKNENRRERLSFSLDAAGNSVVVNGLGRPIKRLWAILPDGRQVTGGSIGAGDRAVLTHSRPSPPFAERAKASRLPEIAFSQNWLIETNLATSLSTGSTSGTTREIPATMFFRHLEPGMYLAELEGSNPFFEPIVAHAGVRRDEAVVLGRMRGQDDS
jgi:hypothetical protein